MLSQTAEKEADEFTDLLITILMNAELREKQYVIKDEDRPIMNQQKRKIQKQQFNKWIEKMSKVSEFGKQNTEKIKEFFRKHENLFGTEFEERYDPYTIFTKIVTIPEEKIE